LEHDRNVRGTALSNLGYYVARVPPPLRHSLAGVHRVGKRDRENDLFYPLPARVRRLERKTRRIKKPSASAHTCETIAKALRLPTLVSPRVHA
jgi:hypothetical protein